MLLILLILLAFLAGSIPFGLLLAKSQGVNLRAVGSGNIGATNVWRAMGKKFGMICFLLDFIKGFVPVICVPLFVKQITFSIEWLPATAALAAILGHNYSPFAGFKGGKGVATSAGVLAALNPVALLLGVIAFGVSLKLSRTVSLSSIIAAMVLALVYPLLAVFPFSIAGFEFNLVTCLFFVLVAILVLLRHRSNITRIFAGTEAKISAKK